MNYVDPSDVKSPKDYIKNVEVLYNGKEDSFSIAKLDWKNDKETYAIRWNVSMREKADSEKSKGNKRCVGMPSSHGLPVWFVLPDEFSMHIQAVLNLLNAKSK